jgi:hypothetical protein
MSKPSVTNKIRALRLAHLVQSLGWEGAMEYVKTLTPEEKKHYFAPND